MDYQTNYEGRREMKAVFNIASKQNPLIIYPNQSLIEELEQDSNSRTMFIVEDFHTSFSVSGQSEFLYNSNKNLEIGIFVEGSVGFYNNNKLETNLCASVFPDFASEPTQETHFRLNGNQLNGIPLVEKPYIKLSFAIRDITNAEEDNNFSYRLVNFENVYSIIFGLY